MAEMTRAWDQHGTMVKEQSRLANRLACAESKDKLLCNVVGTGIGTLNQCKVKWIKFQLMVDSFQLMLNEQSEAGSQFQLLVSVTIATHYLCLLNRLIDSEI